MSRAYFTDCEQATDFLVHGLAKSGGKVFRGEQGLSKTKRFLRLIGNPQDDLRAIHIAGTSGKGTVAYMVDAILRSHGFTTGLLVSPHVYDLRERFQINGNLVSRTVFTNQVNAIMPAIVDRFIHSEAPTYFQVNTAIGFSLLKYYKVDYAVVETGLGGLYDSTNTLERSDKLCVITRIGKDHQRILGNSYREIATQKAGIIHKGNYVITLHQKPGVNRSIDEAASTKNAKVSVENLDNYQNVRLTNRQLMASFQIENITLAFSACRYLAQRDGWEFKAAKAIKALDDLILPGRFDIRQYKDQIFIFDGAHNPQKLAALCSQYADNYHQKAVVIMSLKSDKHARDSIRALMPITRRFVFTRFLSSQDFAAQAHNPHKLVEISNDLGIKAEAAESAGDAITLVGRSDKILVTGSNYLLGEVRQLLED